MDKLYIKTQDGNVPIDDSVASKYHLEAGGETPFLHEMIVDANGRAPAPEPEKKREKGEKEGELMNDEISQLENGITLSQSEIIDFSQGTDSSNR